MTAAGRAHRPAWQALALVVACGLVAGLVSGVPVALHQEWRGRYVSAVLPFVLVGAFATLGPGVVLAALARALRSGPRLPAAALGAFALGLVGLGFNDPFHTAVHEVVVVTSYSAAFGVIVGLGVALARDAWRARQVAKVCARWRPRRSPSEPRHPRVPRAGDSDGPPATRTLDLALAAVVAPALASAALLAVFCLLGPRELRSVTDAVAPFVLGPVHARLLLAGSVGLACLVVSAAVLLRGRPTRRLSPCQRAAGTLAGFASGMIGLPTLLAFLVG